MMHHSSGDIDYGGNNLYVGADSIKEISIPSTQFFCEPINALKYTVYFLKIRFCIFKRDCKIILQE
jgi:hypothetical protein